MTEQYSHAQIADQIDKLSDMVRNSAVETPGGGNRSDITTWGADPTGQTDCSDIIQKMVDEGVQEIRIPNGMFMIDKPVDLKNIGLRGYKSTQWGQDTDEVAVFAGPNLKRDPSKDDLTNSDNKLRNMDSQGFIFTNVRYALYISFKGNGDKETDAGILLLNGYVNHVEGCGFHNTNISLGRVNCVSRIVNNSFTNNRRVGIGYDKTVTTIRFRNNNCQYVDLGFWFSSELVGSVFAENEWEACGAPFVSANYIASTKIEGNWFEKGGKTDEDGKPVNLIDTRQYQGSTSNFSAGNSTRYNSAKMNTMTRDDEDPSNDELGGVSMDYGWVQVRSSTGQRVNLKPTELKYVPDGYSPAKDFSIKTGPLANSWSSLNLEPDGHLRIRPEKGNVHLQRKDTNKPVDLRFASENAEGNTEWDRFGPGRLGAMRHTIPFVRKDKEGKKVDDTYHADTPIAVRWEGEFEEGEPTEHVAFFNATKAGLVEGDRAYVGLWNDDMEIADPFVIGVQCHNPDIEYSHWKPIDSYSGSFGAYKRCKGLYLYFRDKKTGEPALPNRDNPTDGFEFLLVNNG